MGSVLTVLILIDERIQNTVLKEMLGKMYWRKEEEEEEEEEDTVIPQATGSPGPCI
jgi:hypothetical protein